MAIYLNKNYMIKSYAGNGRNLNVYGNEQVSNNRNVCLWTQDTSSKAQQWIIKNISGVQKITTALSSTYALNYYWSNGQGKSDNCDIYPEANNDTDSAITFVTVDADNGIYKIKLKNYALYLTAASNTDNANVSWESSTGTTAQQWKFVDMDEIEDTTENSIIYSDYHILGFNGHGRCVNIYTDSAANGNNITLYDWTDHNDQKWTLERIGTNSSGVYTYNIKSAHSGLYLGYNGTTYCGIKACTVTNDPTKAIVTLDTMSSSNHNYRIKMTIDGKIYYLTAWHGLSTSTSRLVWYDILTTYDQIWKFVTGTAHPYSHTSSNYNFRWPASNYALVNDGYNGLWRQYDNDVDGATTDHKGIDLSQGDGKCYSMFDGTVTQVVNS